MLTGVVYILFGYHYYLHDKEAISGVLYTFGSLAFLSSVLDLSGWKPTQSIFWETSLPIFCFAFIFLSVPLKSKTLLTYGVVFLMVYIGKLTMEYFIDDINWPIALMIIGVSFMALGYGGFQIYKKFLASESLHLHRH